MGEMKSLMKLARKEIRTLAPCAHGGEVSEIARKHGGSKRKILDFSVSVNPLGPSPKALAAIKRNLGQIPFYPDPTSAALRAAIARDIGVSTDNIIVGNGSTELIWLFAGVFIRKGDDALIPAPTFGEYEIAVRRAGGRPKFVKLNRSDFCVKADDFINQMKAQTKVIFLCNPNNPTGRIIPKKELLKIVEEAKRKDILVFIDEDFINFVDGKEQFTLADSTSTHKNTFVSRSFTQAFALPGIRVGYGVGCKEMIELLYRAKVPWNVNCLAQVAAAVALTDKGHISKTQRLVAQERARLLKDLAQINGLKIFSTDANFILMNVKNTGLTAARLKERLLNHGVLVRDCSSFRGLDKHFIRIAIRTRKESTRLLKAMQVALGA